jgi:hypothetical protein
MADALTVSQLEDLARFAYEQGDIEKARMRLAQADELKAQQARDRGELGEAAYAGGAGVLRGAAATVEEVGQAPSALSNMIQRGGQAALEALGLNNLNLISPETQEAALTSIFENPLAKAVQGTQMQGARDVVDRMTGGYSQYKSPQLIGQYTGTMGEFGGGAAVLPFGGLLKSITSSMIPAITSETAGQLAQEYAPEYEGAARMAGAIATPFAQAATTPLQRRLAIGPAEEVFQNVQGQQIDEAARLLQSKGIDVEAGQAIGSPRLMKLQDTLEPTLTQKAQLTRAALREAGIEGDVLATGNVLQSARDRIGGVFDRVDRTITAAPTEADGLAAMAVLDDAQGSATMGNIAGKLTRIADRFSDAAGAGKVISPDDLSATRTELAKAMTQYAKQNDQVNYELAYSLNEILDDMIERQVAAASPDLLGELQNARKQYRAFLTIERAVNRAGSDAGRGIISPNALASAVRTREGNALVRGVGTDLADLASASQQVLTPAPTVSAGGVRDVGGLTKGLLDLAPSIAARVQGESLARPARNVITERLLQRLGRQTGGLLNID